jgi:IMP cyclohydrolase
MISEKDATRLVQDTYNSLHRVGLIENSVTVTGDTIVLGNGSILDSIAFVTFITDLEDRLTRETKKDVFLVLNEIHEFNADNPYLSVDTLVKYIVSITK